jgi:hypothetical protein
VNSQMGMTEILLAYVWRMANAEQYKSHGIYLVLDECQNARSGGKDPPPMAGGFYSPLYFLRVARPPRMCRWALFSSSTART